MFRDYFSGCRYACVCSFRPHRSFLISPFRIYVLSFCVRSWDFSILFFHSSVVCFGRILVTCFTHTNTHRHRWTAKRAWWELIFFRTDTPGIMHRRRLRANEHLGTAKVPTVAACTHFSKSLYAKIKRSRFTKIIIYFEWTEANHIISLPTARVLRKNRHSSFFM